MKRAIDLFILIVTGIVFANSLLWAFSVPLNGAPDEYDHFRLVAFIAEHNRIPVLPKDQDFYFSLIADHLPVAPQLVRFHEQNQKIFARAFLYELKPVYMMWPCAPYLGFAFFLKLLSFLQNVPWIYLARIFSAVCAALTIFVAHDIFKKLAPQDPVLVKMATIFAAFLPQFTFLGAYVNPDIVTALVATLVLRSWFFCLDARWSARSAVVLGTALGLGILSKISGYSVVAATALFLFFFIPRDKGLWRYLGIVLVFCLLASGWFFVRNHLLYADWTGYVAYTRRLAAFVNEAPRFMIEHDIFSFVNRMQYGWRALPYLFHFCFTSFWGVFSWASLRLPDIFYLIAYGLTAAGLTGAAVHFSTRTKAAAGSKMTLLIAAVLGLQVAAVLVYVAMIKYQPQGRYFYPVLAPLAYVLCFGLLAFFRRAQARRACAVGVSVFMIGLNIFSFLYCQALHYFPGI